MAVISNEIKVTHDHDYPSFLEIQVKKRQAYIQRIELELQYMRQDRFAGWFAAGLLLAVLGITLYQWLVVGAGAMSCVV